MKIEITNHLPIPAAYAVPVQVFRFSGGEMHVKIDVDQWNKLLTDKSVIRIHQDIRSAEDFMAVVMVKDAVDNLLRFNSPVPVELVTLYTPYARQDRYCELGEAFGVQKFGAMLNSLNFSRVLVADPHSDVTNAVINNLDVIAQEDIAFEMLSWKLKIEEFDLVSPDGGALKKIFKLAKKTGTNVHCAEKVRDTKTGEIVRTDIAVHDFQGKNLMIVDDIFDGGYTFLKLGELLKQRNAGKVELYVTHGIFSKGVDLLEGYIDKVHCFNVWEDNIKDTNTKGLLVVNQEQVKGSVLHLHHHKNTYRFF